MILALCYYRRITKRRVDESTLRRNVHVLPAAPLSSKFIPSIYPYIVPVTSQRFFISLHSKTDSVWKWCSRDLCSEAAELS